MPQTARFAVLIGVNNYIPYDVANGITPGTNNLRGCVNDASRAFFLTRRLGYPDQNVRVLSKPTITAGMINSDQVHCLPATSHHIREALDWLVGACAEAGEGAVGMVFFSGHGDFSAENHGVVYPYDYTGKPNEDGDDRSVHLGRLIDDFKERTDGATLVLMVDACRDGDGALSRAQVAPINSDPEHCILITACGPGESSYERCIDGTWRGLFGWAMQTVVGQWSLVPDHKDGWYLDLSYDELVRRIGMMPAAIAAEDEVQTPSLYTSPANMQRAVGQLSTTPPGDTSGDPTKPSNGHEFGADTQTTFTSNGKAFAQVYVDSDEKATWAFETTPPFSGIEDFTLAIATGVTSAPAVPGGWTTYTSDSGPLGSPSSTDPTGYTYATNSGGAALKVTGTSLKWWRRQPQGASNVYLVNSNWSDTNPISTVSGTNMRWYHTTDNLS